jgi:hypothetical protein
MKASFALLLLIALIASLGLIQAGPVRADELQAQTAKVDDVTIKHNPDGSIEVFDVPESEQQKQVANSTRRARGRNEAKPAPEPDTQATNAQSAQQDGGADSVFAVRPVVSGRRTTKSSTVKTWSHGISAL